jgi:endonuclease/exonuclease/phosphatase family metal-dependent hydrolase
MKFLFYIILSCTTFVACTTSELPLKVASYNLRMDTPRDSLNAWSYRKDAVNALIQYHDFDIIGTQESFLHQLSDLCQMPAYTYFGAGRDDGKDKGEHSAIVYKKNKFKILDSGNYWLSETPDRPSNGWDAIRYKRICSWAKFKDKNTGKTFYFFNVHFDHQGAIARKESGKLMVQKIKEIAKDAPVICTGDFNSTPETEQIKVMSEFLFNSREVSEMKPYGPTGTTNSAFSHPFTTACIDYIFVSAHFKVSKYAVLTDLRTAQYFPSDHLPVVADIRIK